jgi:hypothetical protein
LILVVLRSVSSSGFGLERQGDNDMRLDRGLLLDFSSILAVVTSSADVIEGTEFRGSTREAVLRALEV